jgi:glycine hydroxymethyltransferase
LEALLEQVNIACNKNTTPQDKSALSPNGVRIGTPAMSSRGMGEADFKRIAGYFDKCISLAKEIQASLPKEANRLKDFKAKVTAGDNQTINSMKKEISAWAIEFPLPV